MAESGGAAKQEQGGLKALLIPLLAVTIVGGGGGGFLGFSLLAKTEGPAKSKASETEQTAPAHEDKADAHGSGKGGGHGAADGKDAAKPGPPPELKVKELPAVVANLSGSDRLVRIQAAIVYDPHELEHADTLVPVLMSDITAFANTLELSQIEGPDGLRRLQEELSERAAIRSERHIREFIIEALVVQ